MDFKVRVGHLVQEFRCLWVVFFFVVDGFFVRESAGMGFVKEEVVLRRHGGVGFVNDTTGFDEVIEFSISTMELLQYFVFHELSPSDLALRNIR